MVHSPSPEALVFWHVKQGRTCHTAWLPSVHSSLYLALHTLPRLIAHVTQTHDLDMRLLAFIMEG